MGSYNRSRFEFEEVDDFGDFWLAPLGEDGAEGLLGRRFFPGGEGLFRR